jgi:hypothetical protein
MNSGEPKVVVGRSPRIRPRKEVRGRVARVLWEPVGSHELVLVALEYATAAWAEWVEYDAPPAALARSVIRGLRFFSGSPHWLVVEEPDGRILGGTRDREWFTPPWPVVAEQLGVGLKLKSCRSAWVDDLALALWAWMPTSSRSVAEANTLLQSFLEREWLRQRHGRWPRMMVSEALAEERRWLLPLPDDLHILEAILEREAAQDLHDD